MRVLSAEWNPASLVLLGNSCVFDPDRAQPALHPALFTFLLASAGLCDVSLRFHSLADDNGLHLIDHREAPACADQLDEALAHLNRVLFGLQDHSVLATRPAGS